MVYITALMFFLFMTGMFWLDPNGGATEDKFQAFCQFADSMTCVSPVTATVSIIYVLTVL